MFCGRSFRVGSEKTRSMYDPNFTEISACPATGKKAFSQPTDSIGESLALATRSSCSSSGHPITSGIWAALSKLPFSDTYP